MQSTQHFQLETPSLRLINCDQNLLAHLFRGDAALADYLKINIPEKWTEFGEAAFRWTEAALEKQPEIAPWLSYLPVLKSENLLVGSCGFVWPRADEGVVEIGYEIAETHRNRGLATEIVRALVGFAFSGEDILKIRANTLPAKNASNAVLQKCGFEHVGDSVDPDEGGVWRWELGKSFA